MPNSFRIGELATRTGRSVHAIRWYEAQGLIPGVLGDGGGRRVYTERHLSWLDLLDRLRRTGRSIAEMREYTSLVKQGRSTLKQRQELLSLHRARVKEMIAEWKLALKLIDSKIDFYGESLRTGQRPKANGQERLDTARKATKRVRRIAYFCRRLPSGTGLLAARFGSPRKRVQI